MTRMPWLHAWAKVAAQSHAAGPARACSPTLRVHHVHRRRGRAAAAEGGARLVDEAVLEEGLTVGRLELPLEL
jgi:hypothetical protein